MTSTSFLTTLFGAATTAQAAARNPTVALMNMVDGVFFLREDRLNDFKERSVEEEGEGEEEIDNGKKK